MSAGPILNKLVAEDIDHKIYLNQKDGISPIQLREMIREELKDFIWTQIRCGVQIQFYKEQLEYLDKRISQIDFSKENPYLDKDYKERLAKIPL